MPPFEKMDRQQDAVLWPGSGFGDKGQFLRGTPTQIKVRWVWKRTFMVGPDGDKVTVDAQVVVGQAIPCGSFMWLGLLADWLGTGSGDHDPELMQVVAMDDTPDIKGRNHRYTVGLAFFRDKPPDTETQVEAGE